MALTNTPPMDALDTIPRPQKGKGQEAVKRRRKTREKKERIHITMGQHSLELLNELAHKTDSNYTLVFRNALRLYAALAEQEEKGNEFYVKDKDGNFTAYRLFF